MTDLAPATASRTGSPARCEPILAACTRSVEVAYALLGIGSIAGVAGLFFLYRGFTSDGFQESLGDGLQVLGYRELGLMALLGGAGFVCAGFVLESVAKAVEGYLDTPA